MTSDRESAGRNPATLFDRDCAERIAHYAKDQSWAETNMKWMERAFAHKYMYNFRALGRPVIQMPADLIVLQEIVWETKPDLIIETGIAHGGSLIWSASMLALLDLCESMAHDDVSGRQPPKRQVVGIDIDIRSHNRTAIESHPLSRWIQLIEGSSVDAAVVNKVYELTAGHSRVMVCLDSNHTHEHVLAELEAYGRLTSVGGYCVVFDTIIENLPDDMFPDRPWGRGNNSRTAVRDYLSRHPEFEIDHQIHVKALMTLAPEGYLRRTMK